MIIQNIEFQEQYKQLDKLCKDMFSTDEGVSTYINEMEKMPYQWKSAIYDWETVFRQLKHLRWMRNQLAHEISINSEFCSQKDIDWVKQFYKDILNRNDPLALAYKAKQDFIHNRNQSSTKKNNVQQPVQKSTNKQKSLWSKIAIKIKSWFS